MFVYRFGQRFTPRYLTVLLNDRMLRLVEPNWLGRLLAMLCLGGRQEGRASKHFASQRTQARVFRGVAPARWPDSRVRQLPGMGLSKSGQGRAWN